jgi:CRP/FNR family transcriptional regulator, cyclic AMP receptor protein
MLTIAEKIHLHTAWGAHKQKTKNRDKIMVKPGNITVTAASLANIDAFRALPESSREKIAALCRGRSIQAKRLIIEKNEQANSVYFVLSGKVTITLFPDAGGEVNFRELGPGQMFGELGVLDGEGRSAEAISSETCAIISLSAANFFAVLAQYPEFSSYVTRRLAKLVRLLSERVVEMSTLGVNNRIHAELLRLARAVDPVSNAVTIERMPTRKDFAARISCNPEAVSREYTVLVRTGILDDKMKGRARRVLDVGRLEEMVKRVTTDPVEFNTEENLRHTTQPLVKHLHRETAPSKIRVVTDDDASRPMARRAANSG